MATGAVRCCNAGLCTSVCAGEHWGAPVPSLNQKLPKGAWSGFNMTFAQAQEECRLQGAALCSSGVAATGICCGIGCEMDRLYFWLDDGSLYRGCIPRLRMGGGRKLASAVDSAPLPHMMTSQVSLPRKIRLPDECREPFAAVAQKQRKYFDGDEGLFRSAKFAFDVHFARVLATLSDRMRPRRIMDIGCGFAVYDTLVLEALNVTEIVLVDKTNTNVDPNKRIGFFSTADSFQFYNDLSCAGKIITKNQRTTSSVRTFDADRSLSPQAVGGRVDILYSILSWCFHYPVETYSQQAGAMVKPGGLLFVTARRGTEQAVLTELGKHGFDERLRFQHESSSRWTELVLQKRKTKKNTM